MAPFAPVNLQVAISILKTPVVLHHNPSERDINLRCGLQFVGSKGSADFTRACASWHKPRLDYSAFGATNAWCR